MSPWWHLIRVPLRVVVRVVSIPFLALMAAGAAAEVTLDELSALDDRLL